MSLSKKILRCLVLVLFAWCAVSNARQQGDQDGGGPVIKVMTYNLKFADPAFNPAWSVRRNWQVDMINKYRPDIIGTQEGLKEQVDFLMDNLPEYVVVGEGRKGGDDDEHMAIFFRRDRFRLREMSTFQLSETPDILGSGPEINPRIVTWVRLAFIDRAAEGGTTSHPQDYRGHWDSTREFYLFNTHFFTGSSGYRLAKLNSARLIMERINAFNRFGEWAPDRPVFLVGDFNATADGEVYKTFIGDGSPDSPFLLKDSMQTNRGIDWVLYKGSVRVLRCETVDYNVDGVYPSDHKPVLAEFEFTDR